MAPRWLLGAAATLLALQWLMPEAPVGLLSQALHDAAHIPWFGLLSWLLCGAFQRARWPRWWLPVLLLALAVGAEAPQRAPSLGDVYRNVLGAGLGWSIWQLRSRPGWRAATLLVGAVIVAAQPVWLEVARTAREAAAPVLFAPQQRGWRALIDNSGDAPWAGRQVSVAGVLRDALTVGVNARPWPGIRLRELNQRWSDGLQLQIEVVLDAAAPIRWYVGTRHVGDDPGGATRSVGLTLHPGLQQLTVPVAALMPGRDGAVQVSELLLYSEAQYAGARWHLLEVALGPPSTRSVKGRH